MLTWVHYFLPPLIRLPHQSLGSRPAMSHSSVSWKFKFYRQSLEDEVEWELYLKEVHYWSLSNVGGVMLPYRFTYFISASHNDCWIPHSHSLLIDLQAQLIFCSGIPPWNSSVTDVSCQRLFSLIELPLLLSHTVFHFITIINLISLRILIRTNSRFRLLLIWYIVADTARPLTVTKLLVSLDRHSGWVDEDNVGCMHLSQVLSVL